MNPRRVRRVDRSTTYGRPQPMKQGTWRRPGQPRIGLVSRRLMVLSILGLLVVVGVWQVFSVRKVEVQVPGGKSSQLEGEVHKALAARITQGNVITLDAEQLEHDIQSADPMLKTVTVRRRWPNGVRVVATLKEPSLGWMSGNQAFLLDRDGSAIGTLPAGSGLPVVMDGSNLPVTMGQRITSSRFVDFVTALAPALSSAGVAPSRYEVKQTTLDLYVATNKGYQLIFDTARPEAEQVSDLRTLLGFLAKQGKTPVEYIDLRIAGKAYYK